MIVEDNTESIIQKHDLAKLQAILAVCLTVEGAAVSYCAVDLGDLRSSIGHDCKLGKKGGVSRPAGYDGIVFTNKAHGPHVEFGIRPHVITIKTKRVLSDGKQVFGTKVNHPGTKAQPFMRPAVDSTWGRCNQIMKTKLGAIAK